MSAVRFRERLTLKDVAATDFHVAAYDVEPSEVIPSTFHPAKVQVMVDAGAINLALYLSPVDAEKLAQVLQRAAAALAPPAAAPEGGSR